MFRLLKLAAYGLLGYAIYEFVRGVLYGAEHAGAAASRFADRSQSGSESSGGGGRQGAGGFGTSGRPEEGARTNMTGPGEGMPVATQESDGGSVPHRVGRGVVTP